MKTAASINATFNTASHPLPILCFGPHLKPDEIGVDLEEIMRSKLFIQAVSGYGKTHALRSLIEGFYGRAQIWVFDPQGDFVSLREKFGDVLIVGGEGGDLPLDVGSVSTFCRSLMEIRASVVFNLTDLPLEQRRAFVDAAFRELMVLPRSASRRLICVLDEIQLFAPQGQTCRSSEALKDALLRGRNQGIAVVGATQRSTNLDKDALAMMDNRMVGRTRLDIDVKRVGADIGLKGATAEQLKTLDRGEFFVQGPAISEELRLVRTGPVETTHFQPGQSPHIAPPASSQIQEMLERLRGLVAPTEPQAEPDDAPRFLSPVAPAKGRESKATLTAVATSVQDAQLIAELRARVSRLQDEIAHAPREIVEVPVEVRVEVEVPVVSPDLARELSAAAHHLLSHGDELIGHGKDMVQEGQQSRALAETILAAIEGVTSFQNTVSIKGAAPPEALHSKGTQTQPSPLSTSSNPNFPRVRNANADNALIIAALVQRKTGATLHQLRLLTGYASKTDALWHEQLRMCQRSGYVMFKDELYSATDLARSEYQDCPPAPCGPALLSKWADTVGQAQGAALRALVGHAPKFMTRTDLGRAAGYPMNGTWSKALNELLKRQSLVQTKGTQLAADQVLVTMVNQTSVSHIGT